VCFHPYRQIPHVLDEGPVVTKIHLVQSADVKKRVLSSHKVQFTPQKCIFPSNEYCPNRPISIKLMIRERFFYFSPYIFKVILNTKLKSPVLARELLINKSIKDSSGRLNNEKNVMF